jgi:leucyl-tRNA synthetase
VTSNAYDPRAIETKWQERWETTRAFHTPNPGDADFDAGKPKYYVLDMFPYPSGAGLHVGHPMGYIGSDIVARKKRMEGCNVLHPMGYDAFGLPAEQYAIQTGQHPGDTTAANVETYRRQLKMIGLSYDWDRELSTSDPAYYKWTQWIFTRLYDRGLAYQTEVPVWWCEELKTVLANEEVINGRSERGDQPCERRPLKQWMLKITAYADRLLEDLDEVQWPESVKSMQREWIGRSHGAEIAFPVQGDVVEPLVVFTTRPDTIFGATFMCVAPEHPLLPELTTDAQRAEVEAYVKAAALKSDLERTDLAKDKSGVFTGGYALNPLMDSEDPKARIPIFVADYVLGSYGTGAIMAVPGHDERDYEYAQKYDLEVIEVVQPPKGTPGLADGVCFSGQGTAINSPGIDGLPTVEATAKIVELLEARGVGAAKTTYRLRDWLFSRQRYWGEPFPILHLEDGERVRVRDEDLPIELPPMDDFTPSEDGAAPLNRAQDWVRTTDPVSGKPALRETDTMPGWAGSCWYYLRFMDPSNDSAALSAEAEQYWGNVDLYIGGVEHAVLHLLYARFWHKVLYDEGLVKTKEPFQKLFNQGMLTAFAYKDSTGRLIPSNEIEEQGGKYVKQDGGEEVEQVIAKMSKSLRNVVNPDQVIEEYGCDTFRLYEMFMGPLSDSKPWNPRDVPGCRRFLDKVWRAFVDADSTDAVRPNLAQDAGGELAGDSLALERSFNRALQRVDASFEHFNFNTAIAGLMTFMNDVGKCAGSLTRSQAERFVCVLSPFAPHVAEELWSRLGHETGVTHAVWPELREEYLVEDSYELIVQIKGKLRARVQAPKDADNAALEALAKEAAAAQLDGQTIVKAIVVPGRLVNFVTR